MFEESNVRDINWGLGYSWLLELAKCMWAHHLWTIKLSLLMPSNILVQECTYFKINSTGLWYLVSVLSHLSLQKEIPHSWVQTFLVAQKWWQWYFEATISCIQGEMTSSEHLTCKSFCVSRKGMWESCEHSGGPCVGFSRPSSGLLA